MLETTRSRVSSVEERCADTLRARSKHRSAGARIVVSIRIVPKDANATQALGTLNVSVSG